IITVRVVQRASLARLAAIVPRINVRWTAHEQQAIEGLEQLVQAQFAADRRHDQRQAPGAGPTPGQVFLADQVIRLLTKHAPVGRNSDYRTLRSHWRNASAQRLYAYTGLAGAHLVLRGCH